VKDVEEEKKISADIQEELTQKLENLLERDRLGGDGESVPETPPNEAAMPLPVSQTSVKESDSETVTNPFYISIKLDLMALALLTVGVFTRMLRLESPHNVVFDEMHYGKYASLYLKNTFFFDSNPPLGKMIVALAGYLAGFDGRFSFDKIGQEYPPEMPLFALRFVPALCGSLLTPSVYLIMTELGMSHYAGGLAAFMVLFDTAILTQSRFILMESIMMFFGLAAILAVIRFRKVSGSPFTKAWFAWLSLSALLISAVFSVKYIGIYTCFLCLFLLVQDFWRLLPNKDLSDRQLLADAASRITLLTVIPAVFYLGLFWLHFTILTKAGTHELIPAEKTELSFWDKFTELQFKMLITNQENVQNHNFASDPTEWPFLTRGIAYYIAKDSNNQVHLMGNILVWYTASLCLVLYSGLLVFYLLRRRRLCYDIDEAEFQRFCTAGEVLLTGYLLHFLPYFFYDRTLFLHHYLPAYLFKLMLAGYFVSHLHYLMTKFTGNKIANTIFSLGVFVWSLGAVYVFIQFSGLSYAHRALSSDDVRALRWKETWDLIIHKK